MPRSNGTFPEYVKIEIDPNKWPPHYYDTARRCMHCGVRWPNIQLFEFCCDCRFNTTTTAGPPDMRWPDAVQQLLEDRFEKLYEKWNEGVTDDQLAWEEIKTNGNIDGSKVSQAVDEFIEDSRNVRSI